MEEPNKGLVEITLLASVTFIIIVTSLILAQNDPFKQGLLHKESQVATTKVVQINERDFLFNDPNVGIRIRKIENQQDYDFRIIYHPAGTKFYPDNAETEHDSVSVQIIPNKPRPVDFAHGSVGVFIFDPDELQTDNYVKYVRDNIAKPAQKDGVVEEMVKWNKTVYTYKSLRSEVFLTAHKERLIVITTFINNENTVNEFEPLIDMVINNIAFY